MAYRELFHIKSEQETPTQANLLIRCGEQHLCFAVCNSSGHVLHELVYAQSAQWDAEDLNAWLQDHPLLQQSFYHTLVTWDHSAALLVPAKFYRMEEARELLLQLHGPQPLADVVSEQVAAWQLYCVYAVPVYQREWIQHHFPTAVFLHQYSTGLKSLGATGDAPLLLADFRNGSFSLMVLRQHQLLLSRTWQYQSPEDVIYYLLRTCEEFGLNRTESQLSISGFIDKDSSLYKELYGYFAQITFREAAWQMPQNEYPAHYFTAVNDLYPCVS